MSDLIEGRYRQYVDALNAAAAKRAEGHVFRTSFELQDKGGPTAKYRRITSGTVNQMTGATAPGSSVEAFVDDFGGVFFPDGWKRPKLKGGPRYDVADDASFAELIRVAGLPYYLYSTRYAASMGFTYPTTTEGASA